MAVVVAGWATGRGGSGSQTLTLPGGIPTDAWMILILLQGSNTAGMGTGAGSALVPAADLGSRRTHTRAAVKTAGQTTWTYTTGGDHAWLLLWGTGAAPLDQWQTSALQLRAATGGSPRNWAICPSVTAARAGLLLAIGLEATNAAESPNTILSVDNSMGEVAWRGQDGTGIETIWVGAKTAAAGATGATTILYRNSQDTNGAGFHVLIPPAAETKTTATTLTLGLDVSGAASKHAHGGSALALDLAAGSDPAKTGTAAATLAAVLALDAIATKTAHAATSLSVILGLDTTAAKRAAAAVGIDLGLHLTAIAEMPVEHKTAAAELGLALALDALAGKTASSDATLTLALDTTGDATKAGRAVMPLHLVLDAIATAAKTTGVDAALTLALAVAAATVTDTQTPDCRTLHIAADDRTITITADDRTLTIARQDRTITIGGC